MELDSADKKGFVPATVGLIIQCVGLKYSRTNRVGTINHISETER
jgi:hypothetical protein